MSVYKRSSSRFWFIEFMHGGKRVRVSSHTEDKTEAEMLERALKMRMHGGERAKFVALLDALLGEREQTHEDIVLEDLADAYARFLKDERARISAETVRKRLSVCGRLAKWSRGSRIVFASDIKVADAWRFISEIGEGGATARTQRNVAGDLSAVWSTLMRRGVATDNPWRSAKPQRNADEEKTGRAFSSDEVKRILCACSEEWEKTACLVALYTGLRLGDVFRLDWRDVDFERGVICVTPNKTARRGITVRVPLCDSLRAHLATKQNQSGLVVGAPCEPSQFGTLRFRGILARAQIEQRDGVKLSFHCFRHTFATWVASVGATEGERLRLGGWCEVKTADIYNHDDTRPREILNALPCVV